MMYPSNSFYANNNINNETYTLDPALLHKPSTYGINSNSNQEAPYSHSFCCNFPSPHNHYENDDAFTEQMYDLYIQNQPRITESNVPDPITTQMVEHTHNTEAILGECKRKDGNVVIEGIPRKRTSKKDRHRKIETAKGPRDRRMRLSLQVARDFFDLQDALGYNKASKTVEWLLSKSKSAIKDLTKPRAMSPSSTSEGEVVYKEKGKNSLSSSKEVKSTRGSTRRSGFSPLAKESRDKARERARERTREKRNEDIGPSSGLEIGISHQMNKLGSWSKDDNNCYQLKFDDGGELSSSMIFNNDMQNNGDPQGHQFTDFSLYGKPWDSLKKSNLH